MGGKRGEERMEETKEERRQEIEVMDKKKCPGEGYETKQIEKW